MKLCDHLVPLMKNIFPDSRIAKEIQMARTKCTGVVKNVLGQCCFDELTEELRKTRFSFLIDESTDIGTVKNMCVCVRYFSLKLNRVTTRFFSLVQCFSSKNADEANTGATAEALVRMGAIQFIQKCVCHSLHLCASEACKVLPRYCEDLARDIFNFFKHSSKRQAQFQEFQEICNIEPHKILRPSQTSGLDTDC
ncbi:uncharacterized protein LOC116182101 [Photinus pyralis]|uniref:uncharacterized protein LOC116182101 n=1 Tax=Photinus pyralis TaxID=7054 RepID=UPI00126707A6|nr:uncharacterized protein LOC116182101 [Photinus pyralis]